MGRYLKVSAFKEQMYRVPGDFLRPFMQTFDDRSHVLTFVYFMSSSAVEGNWPKIAQNGQKLPRVAQNDSTCQFWVTLGYFG